MFWYVKWKENQFDIIQFIFFIQCKCDILLFFNPHYTIVFVLFTKTISLHVLNILNVLNDLNFKLHKPLLMQPMPWEHKFESIDVNLLYMYNDHIYAIGLIITDSTSDNLFIYLIYLFIFFYWGGGHNIIQVHWCWGVFFFIYDTKTSFYCYWYSSYVSVFMKKTLKRWNTSL